VGTEALPAAAALLEPAELGVSAAEAERRLLDRLGLPPRPRPAAGTAVVRFPLETPTVWGGVPRRNPRFTGREELLDDLDLWLRDTTGSASGPGAGSGRCALTGMSGVGKSQIAAEYAHRFAFRYDVVWWVAAGERGGYREQLAALAPALGLRTGQEYGERLRAVLATLRQEDPSLRWLLVLDGADDPGQIADLLPDGPGHVLVTSRNPGWAEHVARLLEVPVYDRAESTAFLRRRAPRLGEEEADRLAEALGDLPLMLAQSADAIGDSGIPVGHYLELLRQGYEEPNIPSDLPGGYRTALEYAIQSLQRRFPEAVDLLRLCVFLGPGRVPLRLLRDVPARDLPERLSWVAGAPEWWGRAVTGLARQSLVEIDRQRDDDGDGAARDDSQDGPGGTIQLPLLVRQVVRAGLRSDEVELYAGTVRRALVAADPGRPTDVRQWPRYAEIVPHLEASGVLRSSERGERALVLNCLSYFYASGEYGAGLRIAEVTAEHWPRLLPAADPHRHDLTHHQANLLRAVGRYADTERLDRSAHATLSGAYGDLDLLTLRAAGGLAADLRALARYPEALDLSERVHRGYREVLGDDDARTLAARNNVAVTLRLLGRYADALALDRATLEARTALLGSRSGRTLYSELSHAQDLRLLGSYDQALSLQQRNLAVHRAVLGADHPQSLQAAHHLGQCLLETGDAARAGEMVHEVWTACERVLGDTDPLSLRAKVAVSCFERRHGDLDRAREADEFVYHHYRRQFGEAHPYAAGVLGNHGLLLRALGDPAATAVLERSLAVMTAAVGEDHPWTLGCALNLAGRRGTAGDGAAFERADRGRATAVLGPEHPLTLASTVALAAALRSRGTLEESAKLEGEAIEKLGRVLGSGHPRTVDARARVLPQWDFEPYST
jgi:tetratricopeptide (TPR) repeat protein